jgi:hypothetical protein
MIILSSNWHTLEYLAALWGKAPRTIEKWADSGFLIDCGFKVAQIHMPYRPFNTSGQGSRRWFVYAPDSDSLTN